MSSSDPRLALTRVLSNERSGDSVLRLVLDAPQPWGPAAPGQFVQVDCPPSESFGLWRPFSLAGARPHDRGTQLEVVYGVVGKRTEGLSRVRPGDEVRVVGPLGRPFRFAPARRPILIGGGRGLAPMLFLEERFRELREDGLLLHGARSARLLIPTTGARYAVHLAVEDESFGAPGVGFRGNVIDLLESLCERNAIDAASIALYACGPNKMLEALSRWAASRGVPCQVSLETHFGCGIGICAACAVPVLDVEDGSGDFGRYRFACLDGPVMDGSKVDWSGVVD